MPVFADSHNSPLVALVAPGAAIVSRLEWTPIPDHPWRRIVAEAIVPYDASLIEVTGRSKLRRITLARQAAMWALRQERSLRHPGARFTLTQIGGWLGGVDHTSVIHGVSAHRRRLDELG